MRTSLRIAAAAAGAALALAAMTACSSASGPSDGGSGDDTPKIAIVLKTLSSEFWQNLKSGAEEKAKELGIELEVFAANSEDDVEGQVTLLQNAIGKGFDAIGVAPISNVNLNNGIAEATKAGIYTVDIDEYVDVDNLAGLGGAVQAFVTTDNEAVGELAGGYIVDQLGGSGQVAIIEGKAGVVSGDDRKNGATSAFEEAGLDIVASQPADWDRTKAYNLAQDYIGKYPDLAAIYCANDTMAMGAQEAVEGSGKDIVVVGTDGNSDAVASVEAGDLSATVKQDSAEVGAQAVELLAGLVEKGGDIDPDAEVQQVRVDAILITPES